MEPCPRCRSDNVRPFGRGELFLLLLVLAGIFVWIGYYDRYLWIVSITLIIISPVAFVLPLRFRCKDCKHVWKAGKTKTPAH